MRTEGGSVDAPRVSVVIPVYNEQEYLADCLTSVLGQTLRCLEVLCINDGSTDSSSAILREFGKKDPRVRVMERSKVGAGAARNMGIQNAHGDYICFMDADDRYPEKDSLQKLYSAAIQNSAQICGGSFGHISADNKDLGHNRFFSGYTFPKSEYVHFKNYQFIFGYQRFIFARSLLTENSIYFPQYLRFQDPPFMARAMLAAEKFFAIPDITYHNRRGHKKIDWTSARRTDFLRGVHDCLLLADAYHLAQLKKLLAKKLVNEYLSPLSAERSDEFCRHFLQVYHALERVPMSGREKYKLHIFICKNRKLFMAFLRMQTIHLGKGLWDTIGKYRKNRRLKQELQDSNALIMDLYLDLLSEKYKDTSRDIEKILTDESVILNDSCYLNSKISHIECLFPGNRSLPGEDHGSYANTFYTCGISPDGNSQIIRQARKAGADALIMEDAFIRSILPVASGDINSKYVRSIGFTIDDRTAYYDATRASGLELLLNDRSFPVTPEERARAQRCMDIILRTHLSKYNHQPIRPVTAGRPGVEKVLVVDQSRNDQSVVRGMADESTFRFMLNSAIGENPDADIIVKMHPDSFWGHRKGFYSHIKREWNIYPLAIPINPISLLKSVDKVYVCTSQLGFEALLCGKETHVFGLPFYAGWGITNDRITCARRSNVRTVIEMFYISYIVYSRYVNPSTHSRCDLESAIEYLLALRDDYFMKNNNMNVPYTILE